MPGFELPDWILMGFYFLLINGIVVWVISRKQKTTEDYFPDGCNLGWFVSGASIFASNFVSEHVAGLACAFADFFDTRFRHRLKKRNAADKGFDG